MTTALSLNAASSIINGQGLSINPALTTAITTFRNFTTVKLVGNIFANANISGNAYANVITALNSLGSGVTKAQWLIDFYPSNIAPVLSQGNISYYGSHASFSNVILAQASLPFSNGMAGFANVFMTSYGYARSAFETISSVNLLKDKLYNQTGIGFTGPQDTVTGGVGTHGPLLANVVTNWGTMYDVRNIGKVNDPYIFGQHLINQGLGYVNGLSDQLTATGLDITNLPDIPSSLSSTTYEDSAATVPSYVGNISIPAIEVVTTTTSVTGSSPTVVLNIYNTVTGSNLQAIVSATGITTTPSSSAQLLTLKDYLDLSKVVDSSLLSQLSAIGVTTFTEFATLLGSRIGSGNFRSWSSMATFLNSLEVPTLSHLPVGATANVLYNSTVTTFNNTYGTGSGPFNNPVLSDYFGTVSGSPCAYTFQTVNSNYNTIGGAVSTAIIALDKAVYDYGTAYAAYDGDFYSNVPVGLSEPSITVITSNVSAVNSALNAISNSSAYYNSAVTYYAALNKLTTEVSNLQKAGVTFGAGTVQVLRSFAENISQTASDKTETYTYQLFANLITNDLGGDTIRAAVAETINGKILNQAGITNFNDPNPRMVVYQSTSQNIPITTYLSHNK